MTRTVAMTGATGFIGWHVARRFLQAGWRVRAIVRPESRRALPDGAERVTGSLDDTDFTATCAGADVIVHLAAVIRGRSAADFTRANVEGTRAVAYAARTLGVRLIHTSSLGVTGPSSPDNPPDEDRAPHPANLYGESKRRSELEVRAVDGLDWTILRPTLVYGPRDHLFFPVFNLASRGLFPMYRPTAAYNLIHVEDVARAFEAAATSPAASGQVLFVGHPSTTTTIDMMKTLADTYARRFRPIVVPRALMWLAAEAGTLASHVRLRMPLDRQRWRELDAPGFICRVDRAQQQIGFVAEIDLVKGFAETAAWYAAEGWTRATPSVAVRGPRRA